uniref:Pantothenate kinase n=1 Tax=Alexandrium monilatum TaxID=311494 RepID=A0A7S4T4L6_9DINO
MVALDVKGAAAAPVSVKVATANADWGGQPGSRLGLDIGGTLAKLVYFESQTRPSWCNGRFAELVMSFGSGLSHGHAAAPGRPAFRRTRSFWGERDEDLSFRDKELAGTFHFLTFRSEQMERFVRLMEEHELHRGMEEIFTTGGGAYKYADLFRERLGVVLQPVDELGVVVQGIAWLVERPVPLGVSWIDDPAGGDTGKYLKHGADALFPFILVNIGSGVSIVRVDGVGKFERVGGSAIGGGTFMGLCRLLCPECTDFCEAGRLAQEGDASSVNLLVEDIYGGDYTLPNGRTLPGKLTASYFAKANGSARDASVIQALVKMVCSNVCQFAHLHALRFKVPRVIFTGNFLRENPVAREVIAENMRSVARANQGEPLQALFLKHEGYFGALGTFLSNIEREERRTNVPVSQRLVPTAVASDPARERSLPRLGLGAGRRTTAAATAAAAVASKAAQSIAKRWRRVSSTVLGDKDSL